MVRLRWAARSFFLFMLIAGIGILGKGHLASAAVKCSVDYVNEEVTVSTSGGSIYVSIDKQKNWDRIEDDIKTNGKEITTTFDISSVLANKEVSIYFSDNLQNEAAEIKLEGLEKIKGKTGVTASGSVINITEVPAGRTVEYRRGNGSVWRDISSKSSICFENNGTMGIYVNKYTLTGMTFTFRLKATKDHRVGKEVKVKVSKKAKAPNVKVDGGKLLVSGLKANGTEYRMKETDPYVKTTQKTMLLEELFPVSKAGVSTSSSSTASPQSISQAGISVPIAGGTFEVRTSATERKGASRSKFVVVPPQENFNAAGKVTVGSELNKKGVSQASITIADASKTIPYEYTLVPSGTKSIDLSKQKWVAITKSGKILLKKAGGTSPENGAILLVRKKSTTDKTTKVVTPASTCHQVVLKL